MSLTSNNKQSGKQGQKNANNFGHNSKFISKPGKAVGINKKPIKTGGTRGS